MAQRLKPQYRIIFRVILLAILGLFIWLGFWAYKQYDYRFSEAVLKSGSIKVYPEMTLSEAVEELENEGLIESKQEYMDYAEQFERESVKAGYYKFQGGETYRTLQNRLYFGQESAVRVTFNNIRTLDKLAGALSKNLMIDSLELYNFMLNDAKEKDNKSYLGHFIPNTYELYWSSSAEEVVDRMKKEYDTFWDKNDRKAKAKKLGLTQDEISTIASIVIEETKVVDEMSDVAGVYINRVAKGIPLQADPTVKFAIGDFSIKRVLNRHLSYDSPYNTYVYSGLPPGVICVPPISAIDATLNYVDNRHSYLYFCASSDFSGRHKFAKNLSEHNRNAAEYHRALNSRNIR